MSSPFTKDEITELYAPFPIKAHSIREGYKNKDKTKVRWFVYLDRVAVQRRLDELFLGEWEFEPTEVHREDTHISITARMVIRGVSRSFIGGNSPNYSDEPLTEDLEKGAITDTFRRVASLWGLGAYLYDSIDIWTDGYEQNNWQQRRERENEAKRIFAQWYDQQISAADEPPNPPQNFSGNSQRVPTDHVEPANGNGKRKSETDEPFNMERLLDRVEPWYNHRNHAANSILKMKDTGELSTTDTETLAICKVFEHRAKSEPLEMSMEQVYEALTATRTAEGSNVPVASLKQWCADGGTIESAFEAIKTYHEHEEMLPTQPKGNGNSEEPTPPAGNGNDIPF